MYINVKTKQTKPGEKVRKVGVHPQNVDAFLKQGFVFATKEDEAAFKKTGLAKKPKLDIK